MRAKAHSRMAVPLAVALSGLFALAMPVLAVALPEVTSNGGTHSFSANYTYVASTGPAVIGTASSTDYQMESGFWHRAMEPVLPDSDLTLDDQADGLDLHPFITLVMAGVSGDPFLIPHADFNSDDLIDVANDLPGFIDRMLHGLLPSAANTVSPVQGSVGVDPNNVALGWVSGERATSFEVYFGYDEISVRTATTSDPEYRGNTTSAGWPLYPLPPSFTFYWRVDSIGAAGISKGTVWTFATAP